MRTVECYTNIAYVFYLVTGSETKPQELNTSIPFTRQLGFHSMRNVLNAYSLAAPCHTLHSKRRLITLPNKPRVPPRSSRMVWYNVQLGTFRSARLSNTNPTHRAMSKACMMKVLVSQSHFKNVGMTHPTKWHRAVATPSQCPIRRSANRVSQAGYCRNCWDLGQALSSASILILKAENLQQ